MVRAQYLLLTGDLKLMRLRAVVGFSMGGMQVFQWMVQYPDFIQKAVPVVASPALTAQDLLIWTSELAVLDIAARKRGTNREGMTALAPLHVLLCWTPRFRVENTTPASFDAFIRDVGKKFEGYNATDWAWQVKAIRGQDILRDYDHSPEKAAHVVKARALVVTLAQDQIVYTEPAKTFARLIKAEAVELTGDCGHFAFLCESDRLRGAIQDFLDR